MGVALCENGFPIQGAPSLCTLEIYILPLPSILFLISLPSLFILSHVTRYHDPSLCSLTSTSRPLRRWLHYIYAFLVFCTLGLRALEVARLAIAQMGVGLLPIGIIPPFLIMGGMLWSRIGRGRGFAVSLAVSLYWLVMTIVLTIKCFRLKAMLDVVPASNSQYPTSDYLLDNIVMLGLTLVSTVLESKHCVSVYSEIQERKRVQRRAVKSVGTVMSGVSATPTYV